MTNLLIEDNNDLSKFSKVNSDYLTVGNLKQSTVRESTLIESTVIKNTVTKEEILRKKNTLRHSKSTALNLKGKSAVMQQWQHYIEKKIGFVLPDEQSKWLSNAVEHTAAAHKLSLAELWNAVQIDDQLQQQLLDTVLIPESRFFRHKPSIEFVTELAMQYKVQSIKSKVESHSKKSIDGRIEGDVEPFRIWSVGCATGQEVWSLAMILASKNLTNHLILGTDINQRALLKARKGQFNQRQKKLIPSVYQHFIQPLAINEQQPCQDLSQYHSTKPYRGSLAPRILVINELSPDEEQTHWQVVATLHKQVRFSWHNIFTQNLATPHLQQVIFCQNMLIYFRQFDQRDILARLAAQCALGGYIILAPGEALFWRPSNMRRVAHLKVNAWQKISA